MPDAISRSSSGAPQNSGRPASPPASRPPFTARPAGGPNGNGGVRQPAGAPRPGAPARPGGGPGRPGGGRPGGGRPGGNARGNGQRGQGRGRAPVNGAGPHTAPIQRPTGPIAIPPQIVVKDLAELLNVTSNEIIRDLIGFGIFAAINEVVSYADAAKVAEQLGFEPEESAAPAPVPAVQARPEAERIG